MSELQGLLDREARRVSAESDAFASVLHRVDRRRRTRRVATAIFALALAAAALSTLVNVFERSEPKPALPPKITKENIGDLRMAWNAAPGGCCPLPSASGDTVYVGWNDGITAYPAYCATGGSSCKPLWIGTVKDVTDRPVTTIVQYKADHLEAPVVADGMVFSVDRDHLYAFPINCATGGATCQPSWFAELPFPSLPVVADGLVVVGTGDGHLAGYPTHCGTGAAICEPTWIAHGDGQPDVGDGVVYGVDFRHIYAYPIDCGDKAMDCPPSWTGDLPRFAQCCWSGPDVADSHVYVGAGNRVYSFAESCGTGATCRPEWVGATREPGGAIISLTVDDGMVFASSTLGGDRYAGSGHIYAFTAGCGRPICHPVWSVRLGADSYLTARNGLLFVASHGGFLAAYLERCDEDPFGCKPAWTLATFDQGAPYRPPSVTDRGVFSGADASRIYTFTVPEGQG